jgi:6,7-dimethyl-8-ribityllumazine synthase
MGEYTEYQDTLDASSMRLAIVAGRFNGEITKLLLDGALHELSEHGLEPHSVRVVWVPGAFEIPLVAKRLAESGEVDAVICLGAVIRGDTPHFEFVAGQCAAGLRQAALETGVPLAFGVLTTDDLDQALARAPAGVREGNKGAEAAATAVEMADLLWRLGKEG